MLTYVSLGVVISTLSLLLETVQTHLLAIGLMLIIAVLFRWFLEAE